MNNAQITHALEEDPITNKKFCGVFPSDKLPQTIDKYPCRFVANTDPSTKPGMHWISIWIGPSDGKGENKRIVGEFFDSNAADVPLVFKDYLEKHTDIWIYNRRKLQSIWSDICGDYCIFYLSHRVVAKGDAREVGDRGRSGSSCVFLSCSWCTQENFC